MSKKDLVPQILKKRLIDQRDGFGAVFFRAVGRDYFLMPRLGD